MNYLQPYNKYPMGEPIEEGFKSWVAIFLLLANLGLAPMSLLGASSKEKQEFVEKQPQDKIDAAIFVKYMTDNKLTNINDAYVKFIKANPGIKTSLSNIKKYINQDGKKVYFDKKYTKHDYSNVNIHKFTPDNWLTDMGDFIPDENEPTINNWIADYEKKTSVEICIITIPSLDDQDIFDYSQEQFDRLGIGKKYTNNGILLVFSMSDRKCRIHTGYGVEEYMSDGYCKQVIENNIVPNFKNKDYEEGIKEALNKIEERIGNEGFELKKKADEERRQHNKERAGEIAMTALEYLIIAGIIAGLVGTIVYLRRKVIRKKAEKQNIINQINKTIDDFNYIKTKLPEDTTSNSKQLINAYKQARKTLEDAKLVFDPLMDKMSKDELNALYKTNFQIYKSLSNAISLYQRIKLKIKSNSEELESMDLFRSQAYTYVDRAIECAEKIKEYGYDPGKIPDKRSIDELNDIYNNIEDLIKTDVDKAWNLYSSWKSNIEDFIKSETSPIMTKFSGIKSAVDKVKNYEKIIGDLYREFKRVASKEEITTVDDMIEKFEDKEAESKDYVALSKELDKILDTMEKSIQRYRDAQRRKEEARRRKEEEEEEERRRRSRSSSSYGGGGYSGGGGFSSGGFGGFSSGGFGGFGGGMSGGGGASGGW